MKIKRPLTAEFAEDAEFFLLFLRELRVLRGE